MDDVVLYKDIKCKVIIKNSKKYLTVDKNENLSQENIDEKAKKYGFKREDNTWRLAVFNLYKDYNLDEGTLYSESIGRFILSNSEVIYAFQMDGCGFSSRYWQITYEEYINYMSWKDDSYYKRQIVDKRPYLDTYFSRKDLFKIVKQYEIKADKEYYLEYLNKPTEIINVIIREKEDKSLKFFQIVYTNLDKVDVDEINDIFSSSAHLYYNGYVSDYEWDRECWSESLCFRDMEKVIAGRVLGESEANDQEERNALKSIILEIDKKDLMNLLDKAIELAKENIKDNLNIEFMNTLIEKYTLAKDKPENVIGGCRAYSYSCQRIGDDREKELLNTMDKAEQIYQRLLDNRKKYNIQQNADGQQHISKDDFLNSYYNKK